MKKHTTSILFAACLGLTACSAAQPAETTATTVAETTQTSATTIAETSAQAAEKTAAADQKLFGKVTVYMPSPFGLADKLAAAFTEKTGVEVEQFQGTTGEILARLEAEQANPVADVVILASWSDGLNMKADGQLESYTPTDADKVNAGWIHLHQPRIRAGQCITRHGYGRPVRTDHHYGTAGISLRDRKTRKA